MTAEGPGPGPLSTGGRASLAGLLILAFGVQVYFVTHYPQPELFGDPAAYLRVGKNLTGGAQRILDDQDPVAVFVAIRGSLYFAAAGAFYGLVDLVRPRDPAFLRIVLAAVNTLGLAGAFLLARQLAGGSAAAGLIAVLLGALHPSLPTHLGRAYPDPLTACLFVWSAFLFVRGRAASDPRSLALSGLLLTGGLLVRPQILGPVMAVVVVLATGTGLARPAVRSRVLAFLAGCLPAVLLWIGLHAAMAATSDRRGTEDEFAGRYGWTVFRSTYPQGFWQYLETDGWEGPYRLRQEPYFEALEAAARRDPAIMASQARAYAFTLGYVSERAAAFALLVLDNAYRLFDHPVNGYRWSYPLPLPWQVPLHHAILVFALCGVALVGARTPADLPAFLIPGCLLILHGLTFPWPRYSQPAVFIVLASAGVFLQALRESPLRTRAALRPPLAALALGLLLSGVGGALFASHPDASRLVSHAATCLILASPFLAVARAYPGPRARAITLLIGLFLLALSTAHAARDVSWHETRMQLGRGAVAVEQRIRFSAEAADKVRRAGEAFVVFDLQTESGEFTEISVSINGRRFPGRDLIPTMPRLPESTTTGSRNPRTYRQWWALALPAGVLGESGAAEARIRIESSGVASPVRLFGDRHARQETEYEGPSFGEWPRAVALKLEYDGDYRTPVRRALASEGTESLIADESGAVRRARGIHRIRLLTLDSNEGGTRFEGEAPRPGSAAAWAFRAFHGPRGEAVIRMSGRSEEIRFPLGSATPFETASGGLSLCYRPLGERGGSPYGGYVLSAASGTPRFEVSFRSGMSVEPMFFVVDARGDRSELEKLFDDCTVPRGSSRLNGAITVIDGTRNSYPGDTGKWGVASVF